MNFWSLVTGILAAACFLIDFFGLPDRGPNRNWRWGRLVSLGLFFFVLSFMLQLLIVTHSPITIG